MLSTTERELLKQHEELCLLLESRKKERGLDFYVPNLVQYKAHRSTKRIVAIVKGNRLGGCLPIDSPILKADGKWSSLNEITVGDWLAGEKGISQVTNVVDSGIKECFEVRFSDGGKVIATEKHLFPLSLGSNKPIQKRNLGLLFDRKVSVSKRGRLFTPKRTIFHEEEPLPLDPYLLGILLGDGCLHNKHGLKFTNFCPDIVTRAERLLHNYGASLKQIGDLEGQYNIRTGGWNRDAMGRIVTNPLNLIAESLGIKVRGDYKFIPEIYLRASEESRKQLLAGLIDTDGSRWDWCSCSKRLADDYAFLVHSLGGKATIKKYAYQNYYRVFSRLNIDLPLCKEYKQFHTRREVDYSSRVVRNIKSIGERRCGDIEVSSPEHTFLSHDWVLTGNSTFGAVETCYHVTKRYPDWYPHERRFKGPVKIRIGTDKFFKIDSVIEPRLRQYMPRGEIIRVRRSPQGYLTKLHTKDGSFIEFLSAEQDQMAWEGQDLDFFWGDEPLKHGHWIATQRGLLDRRGKAVLTFTPLIEPWMKEEIVDKAGQDIDIFYGSTRDNLFDINGEPILTEEDIAFFENQLTEDERETRIFGKFFHLKGIVYKEFDLAVHGITDFKYEQGYPVYCVLDPHDRQPHHCIWAMIDRSGDVVVMYEYVKEGTVSELTAGIKAVEKYFGWNVVRRLIDPNFGRKPLISSGATVIEEIRKFGLQFMEANDDKEGGRLKVKEYLHFNKKKPIDINNRPKLYFVKDYVPKTLHSIMNYQYDEWKQDRERDPKEDVKPQDEHGADCVRYLLMANPRYDSPAIYQPNVEAYY